MKAIICPKYGPPDVLQLKSVEKPVPGDNDVLIRVHATTVNRTDCAILRAKPFIMRFVMGWRKPKKQITGTDFAGTIVATGKNVSLFHVEEKVFASNKGAAKKEAAGHSTRSRRRNSKKLLKAKNLINSNCRLLYGHEGAFSRLSRNFIKSRCPFVQLGIISRGGALPLKSH